MVIRWPTLFGDSVIVRIFIKKSLDFNQKTPQKETSESDGASTRRKSKRPSKKAEKLIKCIHMEKGPEIRIVGGVSAEKKEQTRKEVEQALFSHFKSLSPQEREQFEKFEYPKSEKEITLINFANEETASLYPFGQRFGPALSAS